MIPLVDLRRQYQKYRNELDAAVGEVFADVSFIGGARLAAFEADLSAYLANLAKGTPQADTSSISAQPRSAKHSKPPYYAIGCSSGTDALLLALMALDIGSGAEVITTPYSFIATAEVIALVGAKPVFVDVEPNTYTLAPQAVAAAVTPRTRAIIPVGLFGVPADMDALNVVATKQDIAIIEDAAQSFGAQYKNAPSATLGTVGCTSFFPAKPLGGAGDGGAVFVRQSHLAEKLRCLLNHGQSQRYYHTSIGINGRLDTLQAVVLQVKLKHFAAELRRRRSLAARYDQMLDQTRFTPQHVPPHIQSAYAQYSLTCTSARARTQLIKQLHNHQIGYGIYYPVPIHLQKAYQSYGYKEGMFPVSERLAETMISLPVHPFLTDDEQERVISAVNGTAS